MTAAEEYSAYLRSAHWRHLRKRYKKERPWRCAVCGSQRGLELHHKTYERRGAELLDDLAPLCPDCHPLLHQLAREGQSGLDPATIFDRKLGRQRRIERAEKRQREAFVPRHIREPGDWRDESRSLPGQASPSS